MKTITVIYTVILALTITLVGCSTVTEPIEPIEPETTLTGKWVLTFTWTSVRPTATLDIVEADNKVYGFIQLGGQKLALFGSSNRTYVTISMEDLMYEYEFADIEADTIKATINDARNFLLGKIHVWNLRERPAVYCCSLDFVAIKQ